MNQIPSGHVSSPNCFPNGDLIPYANKMLAAMQNDARFAGKSFSQMDLLNWFGAEGRRWCSKQELLDKLPAALKQKLNECNALPDETQAPAKDPVTGAPIQNTIVMGRSYCLSELDNNIVSWMLTQLAWEQMGGMPNALRPNLQLPNGSSGTQQLPPIRMPDGRFRLPSGGLQQSPEDPIVGGGDCSKETPFNPSTGYHWCDTKNACIPPSETCPAPEPKTSKTAIVLSVIAGIAVAGTAAFWFATRHKAEKAASGQTETEETE